MQLSGTEIAGRDERQLDRAQRQRVGDRLKIKTESLGKRLRENGHQRDDQEQRDERERHRDEQPAHER